MAIIPGKQKTKLLFVDAKLRKQKKLLYLVAAIILVTAVLYLVYIGKINIVPEPSGTSIISPGSNLSLKIIELLKPVSLDLSLLNDKRFQSLILPGEFPIVPGEKGRPDPFAPF